MHLISTAHDGVQGTFLSRGIGKEHRLNNNKKNEYHFKGQGCIVTYTIMKTSKLVNLLKQEMIGINLNCWSILFSTTHPSPNSSPLKNIA